MTQELREELKAVFLKSESKEGVNQDLGFDYEVITLKLRECALHQPGIDFEKDKEIAALESKLLFLQEDALAKTVKVKINNDDDFKVMKNLWKSANDFNQENELNMLDRLALKLFKYTEQTS